MGEPKVGVRDALLWLYGALVGATISCQKLTECYQKAIILADVNI